MPRGDPTIIGPAHQKIAEIDDQAALYGRHVHPIAVPVARLQSRIDMTDREIVVVGMLAGTDLARLGLFTELGVMQRAHRTGRFIDKTVEVVLG